MAALAALAALTALATLTLELTGLDAGWRRAALEAPRRPALAELTAARATLASLEVWRCSVGSWLNPALGRLCTARRRLPAAGSLLPAARARPGASLAAELAALALRASSRRASGLGGCSRFRQGLRGIWHDKFASL